jgi:putative ABC transport system substrate-binding protein
MKHIANLLALALCAAVPAMAQDAASLPLVGILRINTPDTVEPTATLFRDALAALGQIDSRNIRIEVRLAEGHPERLPDLARALVREKADVIVAYGVPATRAAQQATSTIPIVANTDLLASGLIGGLAKPGGNTTGVSFLTTELDAKKLEILKEILPAARHFGLLNDGAVDRTVQLQALDDAARSLGVQLQRVDVRGRADFSSAFASFRAGDTEAVVILGSPLLFSLREEFGWLNLTHKLPAICEWREMVEAGCLASYGATLRELNATLAALTDKVLRGAHPADTPAEQPTRFELVINLKIAKALGLTIPQTILGRADEVIE